jgi:cysteine desulfurase
MEHQVYMDYNATTPVHPEVLEEMLPFFRDSFGNPSSIHWAGRRAHEAVKLARERTAGLLNCSPTEIVFTSCATESNNIAIKGVATALRNKGNHIITTRVEHPSVLYPSMYLENHGFEVTCIDVDSEGMIDLEALEAAITGKTVLISAMYANNETGTIFPVREIGEIAARHGICYHCDAVQAAGKIPLDWTEMNVSLLSLSGHKLYAPQGTGALIIRKAVKASPLFHGGSQERNRRTGTENVAGIVAMGKACELAQDSMATERIRLRKLRDRLENEIMSRVPHCRRNGHPFKRLPNTSNLSFPFVEPESLLPGLDLAGIAVSSGSACSSGALRSSRVLAAMGLDQETTISHVRFSLGRENSDEDVDYVLGILPRLIERLRESAKVA